MFVLKFIIFLVILVAVLFNGLLLESNDKHRRWRESYRYSIIFNSTYCNQMVILL